MGYDAAMLEINCGPSITRQQLDATIENLVKGVCNNGLVVVLMASRTKQIMYLKLKKISRHQSDLMRTHEPNSI